MPQPIKVLLVEDNRLEARQTQHWLGSIPDNAFAIEWVEQLKPAMERLAVGGIDIILLDLNLPDSRGMETFEKVHELAPNIPIVVLTGEYDESIGPLAVEKGAQDYLIKQQANASSLSRVLRFALARHRAHLEALKSQQERAGKVFGFLGAKGGSGTTTVAVNVAAVLTAQKKKSVILAELRHSFGNLSSLLHQDTARSLQPLLGLPPDRITEHELARQLSDGPADLRILFGAQVQEDFVRIEPTHAEAIVKGLSLMADFVLIDFPSEPSAAMQASVHLCDVVVVVMGREPRAVACGKAAFRQMAVWGVSPARSAAVIVNRTVYPISMGLAEIKSQLGCEILGVVPPAGLECLRAEEKGLPLVLAQPDNDAAISYTDIANHLFSGNFAAI